MQALRLSFISARIRTWNLSAPLFRILGFKSNYMECSDLYIGNCKDDTCVHIYICILGTQMTLVVNGKGLLLEGSNPK